MGESYFPPGSMLRRVQSQRMVGLLYGLRGVLIGATHPVAFTGTYLHTQHAATPVARLAETGVIFERVILGSREEADRALRITDARHKRVVGTLGADAGPYPASTPYSAFDPELMLWTWAVLADSSFVYYQLFVRRLCDREREELYQDWVRWGELFGMPRSTAPMSYQAFREWWSTELASPARHLTPLAKLTAESVCFHHPVPFSARPGRTLSALLLRGALPPNIRRMYGMTWTPAFAASFRSAVAGLRSGTIRPPFARTGRCEPIFKFNADYERAQVSRGRSTISSAALRERDARILTDSPIR